jgi:aminopeptidase N
MKYYRLLLILLFTVLQIHAQPFTRKDSLQGGLRPERTSFDVQRYDLDITVHPDTKRIEGSNAITFTVVNPTQKIQLDLFSNMNIDRIVHNGRKLRYTREYGAVFIQFPKKLAQGSTHTVVVHYHGNPIAAKNAPWDGGFVWKTDNNNHPFIGVAVQGTGASLWYPCKDTQTDEPNLGASVKVTVPNGLTAVANGRLKDTKAINDRFTQWHWEVVNPINNYCITLNIGKYAHIHQKHNALDLDYYVLEYNAEKAQKHFEEVIPMMQCFESKFGAYPFIEDSYKLVESPYLGMEHQSSVAYGNAYLKGYRGTDLSYTGIGLKFDYLIIHETAHEWFGNSITSQDIADMWIHESFAQYAEIVFVECQFGYESAMKYANGLKLNVQNDKPIIGHYGVNCKGSGDMYPKGAVMLNTLRYVVNNDALWWKTLYQFCTTYKHQIITTETVISFFNNALGKDYTPIFNQYLRHKNLPKLEYKIENNQLHYRWLADEKDFNLPMEFTLNDTTHRVQPTTSWQTAPFTVLSTDTITANQQKYYSY